MSKRKQTPHSKAPEPKTVRKQADRAANQYAINISGRDQDLTIARARSGFAMHKSKLSDLRREVRAKRLARSQDIAERAVRRRFLARERDMERGIRAYWMVLKRKVRVGSVRGGKRRKAKPSRIKLGVTKGLARLPSYGGPILDSKGRRGVFMSVEYFGARRTRFGVGKRFVVYITRDLGLEYDEAGQAIVLSNVGENVEEQVAAFELMEIINRAARGNGKLLFSMIVGLPDDLPVEARRQILHRFCEEAFGAFDLPYCAALHEPSAEGDQRNKHAHVLFALRPMVRTGDHQWEVGRELLTEHDCKERFFELRKLFAEVMTEVAHEHGKARRNYTHLSNAARGLKAEPQEPLDPALTAIVRRGGEVAANERNRQRIREGERLMAADQAKRRASAPKAAANRLRESVTRLTALLPAPHPAKTVKVLTAPAVPRPEQAPRTQLPAQTDRSKPWIDVATLPSPPLAAESQPIQRSAAKLSNLPSIPGDARQTPTFPASPPTPAVRAWLVPSGLRLPAMPKLPRPAINPAAIRLPKLPAGGIPRTGFVPMQIPSISLQMVGVPMGLPMPTATSAAATWPMTTAVSGPAIRPGLPVPLAAHVSDIMLPAVRHRSTSYPDAQSLERAAWLHPAPIKPQRELPKPPWIAASIGFSDHLLAMLERFNLAKQEAEAKANDRVRRRGPWPPERDFSR